MPLPQQLARVTPERLKNNDPKSQNLCASVTKSRTRERGTSKDRWQPEDVLGSSIFSTAPVPGGVASGQSRQNVHHVGTFQSGSSEPRSPPGQLFESHSMSCQLGILSEVDPGQAGCRVIPTPSHSHHEGNRFARSVPVVDFSVIIEYASTSKLPNGRALHRH